MQYSVAVRNARQDAVETTIGVSARLRVGTGGGPVDCAAADTGTLLVDITLPSDWMNAAASGAKTKLGTWSGTAVASGTPGHWRLKETTAVTTHQQGTAGVGSGELSFDAAVAAIGQTVIINVFTVTDGNA